MLKFLSTIANIIKYPFLGLIFVIYKIFESIYFFIKFVIKGIAAVFYSPIYLISKIKTKKQKVKYSQKHVNQNKISKQQSRLDKINTKKQLLEEQKLLKKQARLDKIEEQKNKKQIEQQKRESLKYQRITDRKTKRELGRQKREEIKNKKIADKKTRKQYLNEIKQEKINKKNEEKRLKLEARKAKEQQLVEIKEKREEEKRLKHANDPKFLKRQQERKNKIELRKQAKFERQEQRRLVRETREQLIKAKLEKKVELELQKEKLNEERTLKKVQEREDLKLAKEKLKEAKKIQKGNLTFKQKIVQFFKSIVLFPKKILIKIKEKINNLPAIRNARNKRDINRQALMLEFEGKDAVKNVNKIVYVYEAKNPDGKIVKEHFAAYSKVEVHSFLLSEGYEVYSIKTNPFIQLLYKENGSTKFKTKDLVFFLTQLSTYLKAGIPLVDALKILSRQYKQRVYKDVFRKVIYDLSTGESFSSSMTKQGNTFPKLLINMVKAAEITGELTETLDDMANYYTEADKTKKQMVNALMYPTIVFTMSIGVIVFILVFVIPKFTDMYKSIDESKIPGFTLVIMAISSFIKSYYIFIIIGIVLFIILFAFAYKKLKSFKTGVQWVLMHLPVIGNVIIYNEVTMFTKTFSSLLIHNVYITDSMEILNKITNNEIYKMIITDTVTNLAKGEKISLAFKDHWAFPIPAYEMLVTGESTGQLAEMMQKVSSYYQDLHKDMVTRIKTLMEPILLVFLTVVVGVIVLAIIIPMFGLYDTVQQI